MSVAKPYVLLPFCGLLFFGCQENVLDKGGEPAAVKDATPAHLTPAPWRELAKEMKQGDTTFIPIDSAKPRPNATYTEHRPSTKNLEKSSTGGAYSIKVCADTGFTGTCWTIYRDDYYNNLNYAFNGFNDVISSIQLTNTGGENPYFCVDSDWRGTCLQFSGDVRDLRAYNFNDVITSIKWLPSGVGGVTVYEDANYGGRSYTLLYPFDYNEMPDWTDNRVSSLQVLTGTPTFYALPWWMGGSWTPVQSSTPTLASGVNDVLSSVSW